MAGKDGKGQLSDSADFEPRRRKASWREMTQSFFGGGGGAQRWREEPRRVSGGKHRRRAVLNWAKKAGAAVLAASLIALFLYFVFWGETITPIVAYAATDYPAPLPPNAWSREDSWRLNLPRKNGNFQPVYPVESPPKTPETLVNWEQAAATKDWLHHLRGAVQAGAKQAAKTKQRVLILYLSMHGAVSETEQPCLLLPNLRALPQDWLTPEKSDLGIPLMKVMNEIQTIAAEHNVNALVALDANRIDQLWDLGVLQSDFAAQARATIENDHGEGPKKDPWPNLSVLNSTGDGQLAWASPEMRHSVFAFYFEQGLRGAADKLPNGDSGDNVVTLRELHEYVRDHVDGWVRRQFGDQVHQEPALWKATDAELKLANCEPGFTAAMPERSPAKREAVSRVLKRFQLESKQTEDDGFRRTKPIAWERRRSDLLRFEQLSAAGDAYISATRELEKRLEQYAVPAIADDTSQAGPGGVSFALASRFLAGNTELSLSPELQGKFRSDIDGFAKRKDAEQSGGGPSEKPPAPTAGNPASPPDVAVSAAEGAAPAKQELATNPAATAGDQPTDQKPVEKAEEKPEDQRKLTDESLRVKTAVAWQWFRSRSHGRDEVGRVLTELFSKLPNGGQPTSVELQWMRLLHRDLDVEFWQKHRDWVRELADLRELSESAAAFVAPTESYGEVRRTHSLRAFLVLQDALTELEDRRRRQFEDRALIGNVEVGPGFENDLRQLRGEYEALLALTADMDAALARWEEIVAELPHLMAWQQRLLHLGLVRDDATAKADFPLNSEEIKTLLDSLDQLEQTLADPSELFPPSDSSAESGESKYQQARARVAKALADVEAPVNVLEMEYKDELRDVFKGGSKQDDLRRAELLLAGSVLYFDGLDDHSRDRLLQKRDEFAKDLYDVSPPTGQMRKVATKPSKQPAESASTAMDASKELARWSLGEGALREALKQVSSPESRLQDAWRSEARDALEKALREIDTTTRRAAAFAPYVIPLDAKRQGLDSKEVDGKYSDGVPAEPAEQRAWLELAGFLQWQGKRFVEDFWGDANPELAIPSMPGAQPDDANAVAAAKSHYFERAATPFVAAGESVAQRRSPGDKPEYPAAFGALKKLADETAGRLATAKKAAEKGVVPESRVVKSSARRIDASQLAVEFEDQATRNQGVLPVGQAAVWITGLKGLEVAASSPLRDGRGVGAGETLAALPIQFNGANAISAETVIAATLLYRGHYWRGFWKLEASERPLTVYYAPPKPSAPQVLVSDPESKQVAFSIVLDCSASMHPEGGSNMLQTAINSLQETLTPVAESGNHRVALWLFAHRIQAKGNTERQGYDLVPSPFFQTLGQPIFHPDDDVEAFRPMGPFTQQDRDVLINKLRVARITPWGGTPLYASIEQALLTDQRARNNGFRHHLIVITDGVNRLVRDAEYPILAPPGQQNPPASKLNQPDIPQLRKTFLREGLQNPIARLDIVNIQRPDEQGERLEDNKALVQLAKETGGGLINAPGAKDLAEELKKRIGMQKFVVYEGTTAKSNETRLNEWATVSDPISADQMVTAKVVESSVQSEPFPLLGSERMELQVAKVNGKESLVHLRYSENNDVPSDSSNKSFLATAHETRNPRLEGRPDDLMFRVSLQDVDEKKYLAPPAEAWAEIELPKRNGEPRTYLAYDLRLEEKSPAAILTWTVRGYPKGSEDERATLRIWWRSSPSKPLAEPNVDMLLKEDYSKAAPGLTLRGKLEGLKLTVLERHDPEELPETKTSNGVRWYRVEVSQPAKNIQSIARDFFPNDRSATHVFEFQGVSEGDVRASRVIIRELEFARAGASKDLHFASIPGVRLQPPPQ